MPITKHKVKIMYRENSLIITKLNIPTVDFKLIKRSRLFEKLDGYLKYKLILINAPAGYGKTALITSWLSQKQKGKTIISWLSLDEEDNDPELFWSYFLLSFYKNAEKENCLSSYQNSEKFNRLQLTNLINSAANLDRDVLMVLEDFNVITNNKIIKDLKYLIKNMPPNMHILISSRSFIDLGLVKFRVSEDILEINENDLIFTLEETGEFFNKAANISLSEEKCKLINNETEGWIAAMQIFALMMKNIDENSFDKYINGNKNFIFNYIAEEVFSNLHESIKKFLVLTSVFDQFSFEVCNYVLGISNSQEIITEILDSNLFIISIDDEKKWFRYQNLFRGFLKSHLDDLESAKKYELFNRIGEWYESKKQIRMAIENYIKGNDFRKASELIQQISPKMLYRGEANLLYKWNKMLPECIVNTNPRLILNSAWGASSDGNKEKVNEYINKIKELNIDFKLKAEITALRSTNLVGTDDVDEIIEECKDVIKCLEPEEFLAQLINLNIAIAYFNKGKPDEAAYYFEKCLSIGIETDQLYIVVMANVALNTLMRLRGEYIQVKEQNEKLISNLILKRNVLLPAIGLLYEQLAEVYYEWNELKKSLENAKRGLNLGIAGGDIWTISENYLVLAKIYNAMGLEEDSLASMEKAEEIIKDNNLFEIRIRLECYKAEIKLQKELENPISKWLDDIILLKKVNMAVIYPDIYIIKIRYYINKNLLIKAKEIVDMLRISAEENGLIRILIEVKILSSIIHNKSGNEAEALNELNSAINLSLNEKPIQLYLNK